MYSKCHFANIKFHKNIHWKCDCFWDNVQFHAILLMSGLVAESTHRVDDLIKDFCWSNTSHSNIQHVHILFLLISWLFAWFPAIFGQVLVFLRKFLPFGAKNESQKMNWLYISSQSSKTHRGWWFLMNSPSMNFVSHFS